MKRYEYQVVRHHVGPRVDPYKAEVALLNEHGQHGWHLSAVVPPDDEDVATYYFARLLPERT